MPTIPWMITQILAWISVNSGLFLPEALAVYHGLCVILVGWFGVKWILYETGGGHRGAVIEQAFQMLVTILLVGFLLNNYNVPSAILGGYSVHQIIPQIGVWAMGLVNASSLAACSTAMDAAVAGAVKPTSMPLEYITYFLMEGMVWLLEGVMFALSTVSFVFLAVGIVLGPLSIVCRAFPVSWGKQMFWSWVGYMVSYGMFGVVGAVLVSVWSGAILAAMGFLFHGSYTGIEAVVVLKLMFFMTAGFLWLAFKTERIVGSLYGAAAFGAAGYGDFLRGML